MPMCLKPTGASLLNQTGVQIAVRATLSKCGLFAIESRYHFVSFLRMSSNSLRRFALVLG